MLVTDGFQLTSQLSHPDARLGEADDQPTHEALLYEQQASIALILEVSHRDGAHGFEVDTSIRLGQSLLKVMKDF